MRDVCAFHHTHSGAMDFADKALNAGSYKDALGELLALSVDTGLGKYLEWINGETSLSLT